MTEKKLKVTIEYRDGDVKTFEADDILMVFGKKLQEINGVGSIQEVGTALACSNNFAERVLEDDSIKRLREHVGKLRVINTIEKAIDKMLGKAAEDELDAAIKAVDAFMKEKFGKP